MDDERAFRLGYMVGVAESLCRAVLLLIDVVEDNGVSSDKVQTALSHARFTLEQWKASREGGARSSPVAASWPQAPPAGAPPR